MRLGLLVVALILSWMHLAGSSRGLKGKRQRRISAEGSQACAKGCELCSEVNGCLKCSPKLFILLERNDIRQVGICLPSCPPGYYDARNPDMNKCIKCKIENCEACFSHNFCTKCKEGLYLHKGRCYPTCPDGSSAANGTMECSGPAQCEMSEWSPWGPCSKKKKLCGFRRGSEERTRLVLQAPSGDRSVCPSTKETRKCTVQRIPCPDGQKRRKNGPGRQENANGNLSRKENKEARLGSPRRRKGQQQQQQQQQSPPPPPPPPPPQHQGTEGPITPAA